MAGISGDILGIFQGYFNECVQGNVKEYPGLSMVICIVLECPPPFFFFPSRGPKESDELVSKYGFNYTGTYKWVDH